jgi:hypothetical protein
MAGFLDSKERVIDMVLTDVGKSLLLKGDLHFTYWIPFDDEIDYDPIVVESASLDARDLQLKKTMIAEDPLIREATMGYRGLNYTQADTTNVHRPMYSAPPGVGQTYPLLSASISTGSLIVPVVQTKQSKLYVQYDDKGQTIIRTIGPGEVAFNRKGTAEITLQADYPTDRNELPRDILLEGFLITMYHSSSMKKDELGQDVGGYEEILQNRDSQGSIVYRNDLALDNFTP